MPTACRTLADRRPSTDNPHLFRRASEASAWGQRTWTSWASAYPAAPESTARQQQVAAVGRRIIVGVGRERHDWDWTFALLEAPAAAVCLPDGKVAITTAALTLADNEGELAALLAHVIAHSVARHGGERLSHPSVMNLGTVVDHGLPAADLIQWQRLLAYGGRNGAGLELSYGSTHEAVADELALRYLAAAGYPPQTAVTFWERVGTSSAAAARQLTALHPVTPARLTRLRQRAAHASTSADGRL